MDSIVENNIENNNDIPNKPDSSRRKRGAIIGAASAVTLIVVVILATSLTIKSSTETKPIPSELRRLDCLPKARVYESLNTKANCELNKKCIYDSNVLKSGAPQCYYDVEKLKFKLISEKTTNLGKQYLIESIGTPSQRLTVDFEDLTEDTLRFKITIENSQRYEVPIDIKKVTSKPDNTKYEIKISEDRNDFYFKVIRKSTKTVIFDTTIGGLIFEDKKIQIATLLPSKYVYGFGENNHESLMHDLNFKSWPIFNRDQAPGSVKYSNLYASHPFYTCLENDGNSHGVAFINSNAMEYEFLPEPGLILRTTGGLLDFYVFLGPEPENVIQQFTEFIGRPFLIPYWALGFQISRYGYGDLNHMKDVYNRFQKYKIPLDTLVADIDHFDERKDFTVDPVNFGGLNDFLIELEVDGLKAVKIFDPVLIVNESNYMPFQRGKEKNVFITWPGVTDDYIYTNSTIMVGFCWPKGRVAYPDFFKSSTKEWWTNEIVQHLGNLLYHGLWIDMNDPSNFGTNDERPFNWPEDDKPYWSLKCPDDEYETVETKASYLYKMNNKLSDRTLCMTARQGENNEYKHYDVHNLYGHTEAIATHFAAEKISKGRGLVITRSSYLGTGKYAGTWTGDNQSIWPDLHKSIIGMLEFNFFGMPYVGADICGFFGNTTEELCLRWSLLGAFYPFSRNHNNKGERDQDPGSFTEQVALSVKRVLEIRYEMLPYYYTLFFNAHIYGNTVVRPLFHEYPKDKSTYSIDKQFMVGSGILISPVLEEGKTNVNAYFPKGYWYSYYDGELINSNGMSKTVNAPLDIIPIHIRGGYVIPTQEPANTTQFSRMNPFGLIVALNEFGESNGVLYYDDGESKDYENGIYYHASFIVKEKKIKMNIENNRYSMANQKLNKIRIFLPSVKNLLFKVNSHNLDSNQVNYKQNEIVLTNLNLGMSQSFEISW